MSSNPPDCAKLKAQFPALFANRRRLRINNPNCKDYIHLVGTCVYGVSANTGYSTRLNTITIGRIYGDQPNGVGKIEFNERFLEKHPEYAEVDVYRISNRPGGVLVVPKGTEVTPQDLAKAAYDDIRAQSGGTQLNGRDKARLNAILEHASTQVDTQEIKERNNLRQRKQPETEAQTSNTWSKEESTQQMQHWAQQNQQLQAILGQESDQDALAAEVERDAECCCLVPQGVDLTALLVEEICAQFPELKEPLTAQLGPILSTGYNFLQLPWELSSMLTLPQLPELSVGASLSLQGLLAQHPIAAALAELTPHPECKASSKGKTSSKAKTKPKAEVCEPASPELSPELQTELLRTLIIAAALNSNFKLEALDDVLTSYALPYSGPVTAAQLQALNEVDSTALWRAHNAALAPKTASTPLLLDVRLAAPYDPALAHAKRRLIAQRSAELLLSLLSSIDPELNSEEDLAQYDAQAAHLAANIAATLTTPPQTQNTLQLAALAVPQDGTLCYCASYEGELPSAAAQLYAQGLSLCPEGVLAPDAQPVAAPLLVAAPLMVMARPDLPYSLLLSKLKTWQAQGQRLLMEVNALSPKIRQLITQRVPLEKKSPTVIYHGMKLQALKLQVTWHDLYGMTPHAEEPERTPTWYLYLYFNVAQCDRLQRIMSTSTDYVNKQYQRAQIDLMSALHRSMKVGPVMQYVEPGLRQPLKDQMFQCCSDHTTELNENVNTYCAVHSFKAVLSTEDLPEDLVWHACAQRAQLEQRVATLCTVSAPNQGSAPVSAQSTDSALGSTQSTDSASGTDSAQSSASATDSAQSSASGNAPSSAPNSAPYLTPWPKLGALLACLSQELSETLEHKVAAYQAHHKRTPLQLPDNSVALMLLSLATLSATPEGKLNRKLTAAEKKFVSVLGCDPVKLWNAKG